MSQSVNDIIASLGNYNDRELLELAKEVVDRLELVSSSEYSKIHCVPQRTVNDRCKKGKLLNLKINTANFICANSWI